MLIGIVGKPSAGKSTFLNALTMVGAKVGDYPFTTVDPNRGTAYVRAPCVCKKFGVTCNPKNSICKDGIRYLPVQILDVAGLVPGASEGRGLGNKFLDDLRQADVLIHVVDASGSLDAEGNPIDKGSWDPLKDVEFLVEEIDAWMFNIVKRDYDNFKKKAKAEKIPLSQLLYQKFTGLGINKVVIEDSIREVGIVNDDPSTWDDKLKTLISLIRKRAKPIIIVANKIDQSTAKQNYERLRQSLDTEVFPASALSEVFLRTEAEIHKTIAYTPGDKEFKILNEEALGKQKLSILKRIREEILDVYGTTGVQEVLKYIVFELLKMIVVYPVEDISKLSDKSGNILPDAYLVPQGTTAIEFAGKIHSDFAKNFIHAQLAPTGRRVGADYVLNDGDVIRIVSAVK